MRRMRRRRRRRMRRMKRRLRGGGMDGKKAKGRGARKGCL